MGALLMRIIVRSFLVKVKEKGWLRAGRRGVMNGRRKPNLTFFTWAARWLTALRAGKDFAVYFT